MARKQGGVNKFLNFIGLVDEEPTRKASAGGYADGYGRPSTYVPQQQRSRTEETRKRTVIRDERTRYPSDDRYGSSRTTSRRTSTSDRDASSSAGYDYTPRSESSSRFGSYSDTPTPRAEARPSARAQRQRTLMCSLTTLEDCCDIIDSLIAGNVVVLTLDDIDPKLTQRAIDTLSGAVFALSATIRKASERTYVLAPNTVEVNETYDVERRF